MGFDFAGTYVEIKEHSFIKKEVSDGRMVEITFSERGDGVEIVETFEPDENDPEMQKQGWQAILNNFKKFVEEN